LKLENWTKNSEYPKTTLKPSYDGFVLFSFDPFTSQNNSDAPKSKMKTPFEAVEEWFEIKPKIFSQKPDELYKVLFLPYN